MIFLSERYAKVVTHKGFGICTLKEVVPSNGDSQGYMIDHESFNGKTYNRIDDAVKAIDRSLLKINIPEKDRSPSCGNSQEIKETEN